MKTDTQISASEQPLSTPARLALRLAFVAAAVLLAWSIDVGSLLPSDDAIYVRAAMESFRSGRLLDVTWMGRPLFEKGPVLFSAIQLSSAAGGPIEVAARIPGVVAGLILLLLIYRTARDFGFSRLASLTASAFCLATGLFYFNARRPMTDIPGLMFAMAGFRSVLAARRSRDAVVGGVMFGLASLCKLTMPVPFMAAAVVVRLIRGENGGVAAFTRWVALWAAGFAATLVPWHAAMAAVHGRQFVATYFGYHLLHRMGTALVGNGSAEVYAGWLMERDFAATLMLASAVPLLVIGAVRRDRRALSIAAMAAMAILPLVATATALPHYLVPVLPAASLTVGLAAEKAMDATTRLPRGRIAAAVVILAMCGAVFAGTSLHDMLNPDYGRDSKAVCAAMRQDRSVARLAGTFDLHDTAIPLYCDAGIAFFGFNPGFVNAVKDIPMLQGVYKPFAVSTLKGLADTGELLITDERGARQLEILARESGIATSTRTFGNRIVVRFEASGGDL